MKDNRTYLKKLKSLGKVQGNAQLSQVQVSMEQYIEAQYKRSAAS